jgi:hypothetical protein
MNSFNKGKCNSSLTIVINTCDAYADVLSLFFAAFHEYWPNCPYPVVINTESKTYSEYQARTQIYGMPGSKDRWGDRLINTLNSIDSEFVLMLYDDFILEAKVENSEIEEVLDLLISNSDAAVAYLMDTALPTQAEKMNTRFLKILAKADYRLNSSPAIWRRKLLNSYTGVNDNPWAWEVFGTYRTFGDGKIFYTPNPAERDIFQFNHSNGGAIYRGKWVRDIVVDKIIKYDLPIDLDVRGFIEHDSHQARSLMWKVKFMILGFRMVGLKSVFFIYSYLKAKIKF